jgi:imidazolonepropionase-like amidohydrolase
MPTLVTYYESQLHHHEGLLPDYMIRKEKEIFPLIEAGFRDAVSSKIPTVAGSDSGMPYTPFGKSSAEELELMVKLGGMAVIDAITSGTLNAARALGLEKETGSIEVGKSADLLVLSKGLDPIEDITVLQQKESIERVYLRGKCVIQR